MSRKTLFIFAATVDCRNRRWPGPWVQVAALARIEGAQDNVTVGTLERLVVALDGQFCVSIMPAEFPSPQASPWWEMQGIQANPTSGWTIKGAGCNKHR